MRLEGVWVILILAVIVAEVVESRKQYQFKQFTYRKKRDVSYKMDCSNLIISAVCLNSHRFNYDIRI
jgi:hypothetical protein